MPLFDEITVALAVGVGLLLIAVTQVVRVLRLTRSTGLRWAWIGLGAIIGAFAVGHLALIWLLPRNTGGALIHVIVLLLVLGSLFIRIVAHLSLQTAREVSRLATLEREAVMDPLTGVYNRRTFADQVRREIALAERNHCDLSLLVIDLDMFKAINDTYGHSVGDRVLTVVAKVLEANVRATDVVVRYGGEEFVVIAPLADAPSAVSMADRLRRQVAATEIVCQGSVSVSVTASIGTAALLAGDTAESLFERADAAVYAAKRQGRNRVVQGNPDATGWQALPASDDAAHSGTTATAA